MASRFYFPASTSADVSPAFDAGWSNTSQGVRRRLVLQKGTSSIADGTTSNLPGAANRQRLDRQYVSDPIAAQTITGTLKMQLLVRESNADDNVDQLFLSVRVVSNDGSSFRGTLLSLGNYGPTTEYQTSQRNKKGADGDSLASVSAQDGDRIVVEIGHNNSTAGTSPSATARYGENATDLPEDETTTSDGAGWIEFSNEILLKNPGTLAPGDAPSLAGSGSSTVTGSGTAVPGEAPSLAGAGSTTVTGTGTIAPGDAPIFNCEGGAVVGGGTLAPGDAPVLAGAGSSTVTGTGTVAPGGAPSLAAEGSTTVTGAGTAAPGDAPNLSGSGGAVVGSGAIAPGDAPALEGDGSTTVTAAGTAAPGDAPSLSGSGGAVVGTGSIAPGDAPSITGTDGAEPQAWFRALGYTIPQQGERPAALGVLELPAGVPIGDLPYLGTGEAPQSTPRGVLIGPLDEWQTLPLGVARIIELPVDAGAIEVGEAPNLEGAGAPIIAGTGNIRPGDAPSLDGAGTPIVAGTGEIDPGDAPSLAGAINYGPAEIDPGDAPSLAAVGAPVVSGTGAIAPGDAPSLLGEVSLGSGTIEPGDAPVVSGTGAPIVRGTGSLAASAPFLSAAGVRQVEFALVAELNVWATPTYRLIARNVDSGAETLIGTGTNIAGVSLPDGNYRIRVEADGHYWQGARFATEYALTVASGEAGVALPEIRQLSAVSSGSQVQVSWSWEDQAGTTAPADFALWIGASLPVDTSGAPAATVAAVSVGSYSEVMASSASPFYVAVAARLVATVGPVATVLVEPGAAFGAPSGTSARIPDGDWATT